MIDSLASLWETNVNRFYTDSNDKVTIHYKPTRTGSNVRYDEFYNESTNPADPTNIGVTETETNTVDVYGRVHLDLYGASIGGAEADQQIEIGKFSKSDILVTCLLNAVQTSAAGEPIRTSFHNSTYVVVDKDKQRYKVDGIITRGMGDSYLVDVYMSLTNKKDL